MITATVLSVSLLLQSCSSDEEKLRPASPAEALTFEEMETLQPGYRYRLDVTMRNETDTVWEPKKHRLGMIWFQKGVDRPFRSLRRRLEHPVPPGQVLRIEDTIRAPMIPTEFRLSLGIVEENIAWITGYPANTPLNVRVISLPTVETVRRLPVGRIRVVGLDGATWDLLSPWIDADLLPNFRFITKEGAFGRIETLPGSLSPVMWTSIATGVLPERHGISGFQLRDPGSYQLRLARSTDRKVPAFWNIAAAFGLSTAVVNWQVTEPPEEIRGVMLSNIRRILPETTYPSELAGQLLSATGPNLRTSAASNRQPDEWAEVLDRELERLIDVERFLGDEFDTDLGVFYTHSTDEIQHRLWHYMEPEKFQDPILKPSPESISAFGNLIRSHYEKIDQWLGRIKEDTDILILVSDHGAKAANGPRIYVDGTQLLNFLGFAAAGPKGSSDPGSSRCYDCTANPWSRQLHICVNLADREAQGIVAAEDFENVLSELRSEIEKLRLETGSRLFEIITDASIESDLTIEPIPLTSGDLKLEVLGSQRRIPLSSLTKIYDISGTHHPDGILAMMGWPIVPGSIPRSRLVDVMPTLLYLLGLPVAEDLDGGVLTDIVDVGYLRENPVIYIPSYEKLDLQSLVQDQADGLSDDPELLDRLRSLGYIR